MDDPQRSDRPFLQRVRIRDYKSIATADVELGQLTVLVGRNGSGKSNFLDALRFVADGLQTSLDHAVKSRGGIDSVRRISAEPSRSFAIALDVSLPGRQTAVYELEIAARQKGGFQIERESLRIQAAGDVALASYEVESGTLMKASLDNMPPASADRLYLVSASGFPQFRAGYDFLVSMGFYNFNPETMKEFQTPDAGEILHRDGSNIASVLARLNRDQPESAERIRSYLAAITPGIEDVEWISMGPRETLYFTQKFARSPEGRGLFAASMSDGTLRALGILVAVTQQVGPGSPTSLIGIEEPETALHPAAAGALMDALREASSHTQILVTSHSPDLLDQVSLETDRLLAVVAEEGATRVAPLDAASREAIRSHLYSPGELLRLDQLEPSREDLERQERTQLVQSWEPGI
jgi:predicted ATPase